MPRGEEDGVSEIVAVLLLVAIGMILAGVIFGGALSLASGMERSAYVAVDAREDPAGAGIRLSSLGGDALGLSPASAGVPLEIYVDDRVGSHRVVPVGAVGADDLRPGDTLSIWWDGSGYRAAPVLQGHDPLPDGPLDVRLVDGRHHTLIALIEVRSGGSSATTTTASAPELRVDFAVPVVQKDHPAVFTGTVVSGAPETWSWTFTSTGGREYGPYAGRSATFTFTNRGSGWKATLTATDPSGRSFTVTKPVDVQ